MLNIYKNKSFFNKIIAFVLLFIFSFAIFSQNSGVYFSSEKLKALLNTAPYMEMSTTGTEINEKSDLDNINKSAGALAGSYYLLGNQNYGPYYNIVPIGTSSNPFTGEFNGNGFSITIGKINSTAAHVGFFGYVKNATIKNLTIIIKSGITASNVTHFGGICGYAKNSTFENCRFVYQASVNLVLEQSSLSYVGGICGWTDGGTTIENCINNANISVSASAMYIGGVLGFGSKVHNCVNYGNIDCDVSTETYIGGISGSCGYALNSINYGNIDISSSTSYDSHIGGISGYLYSTTESSVLANFGFLNILTNNGSIIAGGIAGLKENYSTLSKVASYGNIAVTKQTTSNPILQVGGLIGKSLRDIKLNDVYSQLTFNVYRILPSCYIGGLVGKCEGIVTLLKARTDTHIMGLGSLDFPLTDSSCVNNVGNMVGNCTSVDIQTGNYIYNQNATYFETKYSSGLTWLSQYYHNGNERRIKAEVTPFINKTSKFLLYDIAGGTNKYLTKTYRYESYSEEDEDYGNSAIDYNKSAVFTLNYDLKDVIGDNVYDYSIEESSYYYMVDYSEHKDDKLTIYHNAYHGYYYGLPYNYLISNWVETKYDASIPLYQTSSENYGIIAYDNGLNSWSSYYNLTDMIPLPILGLNFSPSDGSWSLQNSKGLTFNWLFPTGTYTNLGGSVDFSGSVTMTRLFIKDYNSSKLEWSKYESTGNTYITSGEDFFDNIVLFADDRNSTKWETKAHLLGWCGLVIRYKGDKIIFDLPLIFGVPSSINTNGYYPTFAKMFFANYRLCEVNIDGLAGGDNSNGKTIDYYDRHDSHFGESRWVYNEYGKYMPIELFFIPE